MIIRVVKHNKLLCLCNQNQTEALQTQPKPEPEPEPASVPVGTQLNLPCAGGTLHCKVTDHDEQEKKYTVKSNTWYVTFENDQYTVTAYEAKVSPQELNKLLKLNEQVKREEDERARKQEEDTKREIKQYTDSVDHFKTSFDPPITQRKQEMEKQYADWLRDCSRTSISFRGIDGKPIYFSHKKFCKLSHMYQVIVNHMKPKDYDQYYAYYYYGQSYVRTPDETPNQKYQYIQDLMVHNLIEMLGQNILQDPQYDWFFPQPIDNNYASVWAVVDEVVTKQKDNVWYTFLQDFSTALEMIQNINKRKYNPFDLSELQESYQKRIEWIQKMVDEAEKRPVNTGAKTNYCVNEWIIILREIAKKLAK